MKTKNILRRNGRLCGKDIIRDSFGRFVKGVKSNRFCSVSVCCSHCGKSFLVQPHRFKSGRGKFCSKECRRLGCFTSEVKIKMSQRRKGIPTNRGGNKCHFWRGGVTPINKKIRMSLDTRIWRESVFQRDNYTCQICKTRGGKLQADHIKPFAIFPELRFDLENGRTLCVDCHRKTDTYGYKTSKTVKATDHYSKLLAEYELL
jgi:5-methylcytosine-specific restriction endonuclease McrA